MKNLFILPDFNDEDKQRAGQYLNIIVLFSIVLISILLAFRLSIVFTLSPTNTLLLGLLGILVALRVALQYGYVRSASLLLTTIIWAAMTYQAYSNDGIRDVAVVAYIVVILMVSLLLGLRYSLPFFALSMAAIFIMGNQEANGIRELSFDSPENTTRDLIAVFSLIGVIVYLLVNSLQSSVTAAKASAQKLMISNKELQTLQVKLEQRVADRTKALATSAEVSRRLSTILDADQLVKEVVEQVQKAFNYYHVHIYLFDEKEKSLIMAGGTGDAGRIMLSRGHKIPAGKGLVGRAAETKSLILVSDTTQDPNWLPNPLLPETRSEIAVPVTLGESVLGVLDVQQNIESGLNEEDASLLQAIAYQTAVALRNARAYSQSQAQAEREALINEIGRKIQNTSSVESALQVAVRELGQALGARDTHAIIDLQSAPITKAN